MEQDTKQAIADCLIRAAQILADKVETADDPYHMAHSQFGIAFAANQLSQAGFINYSVHAELEDIRGKAFDAAASAVTRKQSKHHEHGDRMQELGFSAEQREKMKWGAE